MLTIGRNVPHVRQSGEASILPRSTPRPISPIRLGLAADLSGSSRARSILPGAIVPDPMVFQHHGVSRGGGAVQRADLVPRLLPDQAAVRQGRINVGAQLVVAVFEFSPQVAHLACESLHFVVKPPQGPFGEVALGEVALLLHAGLGSKTSVLAFNSAHLLSHRVDTLGGRALLATRRRQR